MELAEHFWEMAGMGNMRGWSLWYQKKMLRNRAFGGQTVCVSHQRQDVPAGCLTSKTCLSRAAAMKKKLNFSDKIKDLNGKVCPNLVNRNKYTLHLAFCNFA